jgi:hypothetical protein
MSLRDEVDNLLPGWESWYPSVFDAAVDLGLLRARVCSPGSLMLSQRHASIYNEAVQAFREQWSAAEPEGETQNDRERRGNRTSDSDDSLASQVTDIASRLERRR